MSSKIFTKQKVVLTIIIGLVFFATFLFITPPMMKNKTMAPAMYHTGILDITQKNENFRHVLFTGQQTQLVVMNIAPGGEVGKETHTYTEQTLFFLSGTGRGEVDGKQFPIVPGDVVVIIPGTEHNFWNTGTQPLKIYTVYAPPNHIDGRVHLTKSDADADTADEAIGETRPLK